MTQALIDEILEAIQGNIDPLFMGLYLILSFLAINFFKAKKLVVARRLNQKTWRIRKTYVVVVTGLVFGLIYFWLTSDTDAMDVLDIKSKILKLLITMVFTIFLNQITNLNKLLNKLFKIEQYQ